MPWGRSGYITLLDLNDFADAYLFRNKLANCITGFVYDHSPDLSGSGAKASLPLPEQLEPGLIAGLPPGKDIKFSTPPGTEGYAPYVSKVLYQVAAAYGLTYESLTGDLSNTNFASGRMGWLQMGRNIDRWRWRMMVPQMCQTVGRWFLEAVRDDRGLDITDARFAWTAPRRQIINPAQEIAAIVAAIRAGLMSLPEAHRELGYNYGDVLREIAESNALVDEYELVLDSDPRKTSAAGLSQARPASPQQTMDDESDGDEPSSTTDEESV
jgi:capsid protein